MPPAGGNSKDWSPSKLIVAPIEAHLLDAKKAGRVRGGKEQLT
jgi:hypothetical protein